MEATIIDNKDIRPDPNIGLPFGFSGIGEDLEPYPTSARRLGNDWVFMVRGAEQDWLMASGAAGKSFSGTAYNGSSLRWVKAPLSSENAQALREMFPFTAPLPVLKNDCTIGLGDRLGLAVAGHLKAVEQYKVFPVLAQQSLRELNLTGRSFSEVLDAASFGVFRAGYARGFGADGDHLKSALEVQQALDAGYTMITLDCSEHIRDDAEDMAISDIAQMSALPQELKDIYLEKSYNLGGSLVCMRLEQLQRNYLKYGAAIDFACDIFDSKIASRKGKVDFEISLDETDTPTKPEQHFFVANELIRRGVLFETLAPRFCGEFQKGVDYIGDIDAFRVDLESHAAIALHFGYKLSIHSGSDKFSVFEAIGQGTRGRFHIKTSGTSWLAAMQLVAEVSPGLYRRIHRFALENFEQARMLYSVTTDISAIPDVDALPDADLGKLFALGDVRQLIHITYGSILTKRGEDGAYLFKDALFSLWRRHAGEYEEMLENHIGKHLETLAVGRL